MARGIKLGNYRAGGARLWLRRPTARWPGEPGAGDVIEFTEWARDILGRAQGAAARFDPDARVRLARTSSGVQALLVHEAEPGDRELDAGGVMVFVEAGLEGLVDIEEPHDRLVLRPPGSTPNARTEH
jgi:hypothetical protein